MRGGRVAWDSCRTIGYRVNRNGESRAELARLRRAFRSVSRVTALRFRYDGPTSVIPLRTPTQASVGSFDARTDVTIAFARAGRGARQAPVWINSPTLGFGGPSISGTSGPDGRWLYRVSGGRVLFNSTLLRDATADQRLAVYMHELGHVIGLAHTASPDQLMYPAQTPGTRPRWGDGDRAGLKRLGYGNRPCR